MAQWFRRRSSSFPSLASWASSGTGRRHRGCLTWHAATLLGTYGIVTDWISVEVLFHDADALLERLTSHDARRCSSSRVQCRCFTNPLDRGLHGAVPGLVRLGRELAGVVESGGARNGTRGLEIGKKSYIYWRDGSVGRERPGRDRHEASGLRVRLAAVPPAAGRAFWSDCWRRSAHAIGAPGVPVVAFSLGARRSRRTARGTVTKAPRRIKISVFVLQWLDHENSMLQWGEKAACPGPGRPPLPFRCLTL